MKFESLPGIPKSWVRFIDGAHPDLTVTSKAALLQSLHSRNQGPVTYPRLEESLVRKLVRDAVTSPEDKREYIQQLDQSGTVAVVASIDPELLGGGLCQFLKCLTAVKVAEELSENSIDAVAVCWIRSQSVQDTFMPQALRLLDSDGKPQRFQSRTTPYNSDDHASVHFYDGVTELTAAIDALGRGSFDSGILASLHTAYSRQDSKSSGLARLLDNLMDAWNIIVMDSRAPDFRTALEDKRVSIFNNAEQWNPGSRNGFSGTPSVDYLMQALIFPRLLSVIDPYDMASFLEVRNVLKAYSGFTPPVWPAISATVIDVDSRRTMKKYRLGMPDLFAGEEKLMETLRARIPVSSAGDTLDILQSEVEQCLDALSVSEPERELFQTLKESCKKRITFQLQKIRNRMKSAGMQKLEVLERRIPQLCASLFPGGKIQERGLSGIYFPLKYSRELLSVLYKKLDFEKWEHQIIEI